MPALQYGHVFNLWEWRLLLVASRRFATRTATEQQYVMNATLNTAIAVSLTHWVPSLAIPTFWTCGAANILLQHFPGVAGMPALCLAVIMTIHWKPGDGNAHLCCHNDHPLEAR